MSGDSGNKNGARARAARNSANAAAARRERGTQRLTAKSDTEAGLTTQQRATLDRVESRSRGLKNEKLTVVDRNGMVTFEKRGGRGSVRFDRRAVPENSVLTHNHPNEQYSSRTMASRIGGSFSDADLSVAKSLNLSEVRAVTEGYTYSMKRGAGGWKNVSTSEIRRVYNRVFNDTYSNYGTLKNGKTGQAWKTARDRAHIVAVHKATQAVAELIGGKYTRRANK